jgi:hypothetical protein
MKITKRQLRRIIKEEIRVHHLREGKAVGQSVGETPVFAEWSADGLVMELKAAGGGNIKFRRQKDVEALITMLEELLAGPMRTSP